jgi:hypothetical protein
MYLVIAGVLLQLANSVYEHSRLGVGLSLIAIIPSLTAFKGVCIVSKVFKNKIFL